MKKLMTLFLALCILTPFSFGETLGQSTPGNNECDSIKITTSMTFAMAISAYRACYSLHCIGGFWGGWSITFCQDVIFSIENPNLIGLNLMIF